MRRLRNNIASIAAHMECILIYCHLEIVSLNHCRYHLIFDHTPFWMIATKAAATKA
jgi:hypothetical protein